MTADGHEADSEEGPTSPRSVTYGAISRSAPSPPQTLKLPKPVKSQTEDNRSKSPVDDGQAPSLPLSAPSPSDDSITPIVSGKRGRRAPSSVNSSDNVPALRQVINTLRRGRRGTSPGGVYAKDDTFAYDDAEITFLDWLDAEIKKINDFYQEKENEAVNRYHVLSQQLEVLQRLRDDQGLPGSNENSQIGSRSEATVSGTIGATLEGALPSSWGTPIKRIRASWDGIHSVMPAADHQRRASHNPDLMAHPISTSTGYVEYRVARRRLKQAVLEFYRGMELLKQYRLLNRTGIAKILKKFDKTSGRRITPEYNQKLKSVYFDQSELLETTMSHTEVTPSIKPLLMHV